MMGKQITSIFMAMALLLTAVGCASQGGSAEDTSQAGSSSQAAASGGRSEAPGTRTVVDYEGVEVEVPEKIERMVIVGPLPLPTVVVACQGGKTDNIVGVAPDSINGASYTIFSKYAPDFLDISSEFYAGGELNMEELANLKPDVVLYSGAQMTELFAQAGIAAVKFAHPNGGGDTSPLSTLESWIDTIEQLLQLEAPMRDVLSYGRQAEQEIAARIAAIPNREEKKILIINNYNDATMSMMGSNSFGHYWAALVGGVNVVGEVKSGEINMEQVYSWAPDQVYLRTFTDRTPEDLYQNTAAEGHDWSGVPAVVNGEVFKFPFGMHRWCAPTTDTPLALWWMAKSAYPEAFADVDLTAKTKEFYQKFYNMTLTDEDVEWILSPNPETKRQYM